MIRFNVGGRYLETPENLSLTFKKTNILFAFDKIECERSTSFDIPATPQNDRIFEISKWLQTDGAGMRRRYAAQMQDAMLTKDGYLYVDAYANGKYKAVFVTGELVGLQTIRNAGKLPDWFFPVGSIVWSVANTQDANATYSQDIAIARYKTNGSPCHPSWDLGGLMQAAYRQLTGKSIPSYTRGFRLIPKTVEPLPKMTVEITYAGTGVNYDESSEPAQYANTMSISSSQPIASVITQQDLVLLIGVGGTQTQWRYLKLHQFVAGQAIIVTFPSDFPNNYYLMSIEDKDTGGSDPEYNPLSNDWFLGGYSFHQKVGGGTVSSGTPLAGRSVEIPSGTPFMILSDDAYEYQPSPFNWDGFRDINATSYTYDFTNITIEGKETAVGDRIRLVDLLPNLTLTDLFKIHSYCSGYQLMYDEENGVSFDPLDLSTWAVKELKDVEQIGQIRRTFGEYAQHNLIRFDSATDVPINQRIEEEYTIDNDNIETEKEIGKIPYSEGSIDADAGYIVARFDEEDTEKHALYADGIMKIGNSTSAYGLRITLTKNAGVQTLCDASTSVQMRVRMTLLEFEKISPKTLLYYNGVRYVWTDAQWSKGTATLKLSKISA